MRSLLAEPRPDQPPVPRWRDFALVAGLLASSAIEVAVRDGVSWGPARVSFVALLAVCLLRRRARPLGAVAVMWSAVGVLAALALLGVDTTAYELNSYVWILVLPYALVRWGSGVEVATGMAIVLAAGVLGFASDPPTAEDAIGGSVALAFPAVLAASTRFRAMARRRELDEVKLREREQIARDLHDTIAHHVAAITIQAQAGRAVAARAPDRAVEALAVIEEEASRTLEEMRSMVGVLRDREGREDPHGSDVREAPTAPRPGVGEIPALARVGGDWPRIEVALRGELEDLSPTVDAAVYRLAQESITNAVRHARHATRVEVVVEGDADAVRLTVRDDGDVRTGDRGVRQGYGLVGMTERATLLGGTLSAGPGADGGWTVRAVLPRAGARP
ncbi:sensor histidine kinase [Egicoccus sp. AB-alg2]|uniref:sensor histidine kinase n=1 Tax=Egicoccus sp. AB-alg2 TaxID=3242693 RepID=UPI00359DEB09